MPRRTIDEELEELVEKHRNIKQIMTGRRVSFNEALKDLIGEKKEEDDFFHL